MATGKFSRVFIWIGVFVISVEAFAGHSRFISNRKMGVIFYQGAARKVQRQWKLRPPNDGSNLLVINLHMLRLPARSVLQLPNGTTLRNMHISQEKLPPCAIFAKRKNSIYTCENTDIRRLCLGQIQSIRTWPPVISLAGFKATVVASYIYVSCNRSTNAQITITPKQHDLHEGAAELLFANEELPCQRLWFERKTVQPLCSPQFSLRSAFRNWSYPLKPTVRTMRLVPSTRAFNSNTRNSSAGSAIEITSFTTTERIYLQQPSGGDWSKLSVIIISVLGALLLTSFGFIARISARLRHLSKLATRTSGDQQPTTANTATSGNATTHEANAASYSSQSTQIETHTYDDINRGWESNSITDALYLTPIPAPPILYMDLASDTTATYALPQPWS